MAESAPSMIVSAGPNRSSASSSGVTFVLDNRSLMAYYHQLMSFAAVPERS